MDNKVTKIELPRRNKINSYFIAGDWHSFHINELCFAALIRHALKFDKKDRRLIINGDFLDLAFLMKKAPDFKKWIKRSDGLDEFFVPKWEEEIAWGNDRLDKLQDVFSEIIFIQGNHDKPRADFFREIAPAGYKELFDYNKALQFRTRAIKVIEYNNWLDIGDLSITHGMFHGTTAHKKHFDASEGNNVIFSHIHHDDKKSFMARGNTKQVYSLPAMCDLNPHYIRNADTNWTNGYGLFHINDVGQPHVKIFNMWNGIIIGEDGKPI